MPRDHQPPTCKTAAQFAALLVLLAVAWPVGAACTAGNPNAKVIETISGAAMVDRGNGTVLDSVTGLMWKQCAEGLSGVGCNNGSATGMDWAATLATANNANAVKFAGYGDWRLPNRRELESIVEYCGYQPSINQGVFPNTFEGFWSASSNVNDPGEAWAVEFSYGSSGARSKATNFHGRLVRGGDSFDVLDGSGSTVSTVSLSVARNGTGSGTVTSSPSGINCGGVCTARFNSGSVVTLNASPATDSTFSGWSGACSQASGACTISMTTTQSVAASFALIPTAPGAPADVVAVGGNAQATISFSPPVNNGAAAITRFTVTASPGGRSASDGASPITVYGLTNGTRYTFSVTATNSAGTSAASMASNAVTPAPALTVSGPPTGVSASAGNAEAIVTFTAPVLTAGEPTFYTATASPGGQSASGSASPMTVTGLINGTSYRFTVTATNAVGTSAASIESNAVTPIAAGAAPTVAQCIVNPALSGCTALCAATPGACAATVSIAQCSINPALSGCAELCAASPGACPTTGVTVSQCAANPALPGCAAICAVTTCSCAAPQVLQNGTCTTPIICVLPKVLRFGVCTTPITCVAPQVLQGDFCVTRVTNAAQVVTDPAGNVTVNAAGALVVTASTGFTAPIVLSATAQQNALVKLDTLQAVSFTSGTTTLQYQDQVGAAELVVRIVGSKPQLEVAKGTVQITSSSIGNTISVMSSDQQETVGSVVTTTNADSVVVVKSETTASVFVYSGQVNYQSPAQATPVPVYQGESTQLDAGGNLNRISLGSLNGVNQVPGDPLPVQISKDSATKIPVLEGPLPRLNNEYSLLDLVGDQIKLLLRDTTGQLRYDRTTGVITYMLGNTAYRLIPLGDVLVKLNQFSDTSTTATAGGAYTLASRGIQMSLSGALGYFSDLQSVVKAADASGTLTLKPTGAIETRFGGGRYVVMPALTASLPANPSLLPGFQSDASGYAVFRDRLGTLQTLYPAFLELDTLYSIFNVAAPTLTLKNNGDGSVTATSTGQSFSLRPDYTIVNTPGARSADSYWTENGMIFFRNGDQSAQGFRAQ